MHHRSLLVLRTLRPMARQWTAWLFSVLLLAGLGWSLAQSNLDKTQALAVERYGAPAGETVAAWRRMLEEARSGDEDQKLKAVNTFFNKRVRYASDQEVWGQNDYWATPLEFMGRAAGDCEDFAIAKYISLLMLGIPNEKLRMIYVRARFGGANSTNSEAHMVLGFYADPAGEPVILDNLVLSIRPAASRTDLAPVFSFNTQGLWVPGASSSSADPTARLSRWRDVLDRLKADGIQL